MLPPQAWRSPCGSGSRSWSSPFRVHRRRSAGTQLSSLLVGSDRGRQPRTRARPRCSHGYRCTCAGPGPCGRRRRGRGTRSGHTGRWLRDETQNTEVLLLTVPAGLGGIGLTEALLARLLVTMETLAPQEARGRLLHAAGVLQTAQRRTLGTLWRSTGAARGSGEHR